MKIALSLALCAALSYAAEDLGLIQVSSSTIDDRFESKKTEVSSTSIISGEKVDEQHAENIQQILQSIPGITTEVKTGDSLKIHIRGVENQMYMGEKPGVAVVIDGVPVFERTGSVNIDLDNIENIKVIKGGASYLFGDDALSGAVIITTKKGAKYDNTFAGFELGSYGAQKLIARQGYANDDLSFHIQATERKGDGYHDKSEYKTQYINGKLQYYIDDSSDINFGAEYSQRTKDSHGTVGGVTEAETNPTGIYNGTQTSRDYVRKFDVELMKLFLTYSKDFDNGSNLLVNGYMYTDTTDYISNPQKYDGTFTAQASYGDDDYVYKNHYEQTQTGIKSEFRDSYDQSASLLGLDLRANEYKNKVNFLVDQALVVYGGGPPAVTNNYYLAGSEYKNDATDEYVYALYGEYKYAFSEVLSVTTNLRYDIIDLEYLDSSNNSYRNDFRVYSYRVGADYQLNEQNTLYINYSTGFRAPTVSQLYAGDLGWDTIANNPDLKPEQSENYEIGIRGHKSNVNYEASIFQIVRDDFIMKTSGNYGDDPTSKKWDNIGGAKHQGLELAVNSEVNNKVAYNLAYTYLRAKYTDYSNFGIHFDADHDGKVEAGEVTSYDVTGNTIPRTSAHTLNIGLDYKPTNGLVITPELNAKSSYYADDLNAIKVPGHATINLLTRYKTKIKDYEISLFGRIENVLDKQYYSTVRASGDRDDNLVFNGEDLSITVNPGRVFTAGLSVKF